MPLAEEWDWEEWWRFYKEPIPNSDCERHDDDYAFYVWWRYGSEYVPPEFFGDDYQEWCGCRIDSFIIDTDGRIPVVGKTLEPDWPLDESEAKDIDPQELTDDRNLEQLRPAAESNAISRFRASLAAESDRAIDSTIRYLCGLKREGIKIRQLKETLEAELLDRSRPLSWRRNNLLSLRAVSDEQLKQEIQELEEFIANNLDLNDMLWCFVQERIERKRMRSVIRWKEFGF